MTAQRSPKKSRLPYKKPGLKIVKLSAKEVLGVGCKTGAGGVSAGQSPCSLGTCATVDAS